MRDLYHGLIVFWSVYLGIGYFMPINNMKVRNNIKITYNKIIIRLFYNMIASGCVVPLIYCIQKIIEYLWYSVIPREPLAPVKIITFLWFNYLIKYLIALIMIEIWFYYSHRLMHKFFYRLHKDHHAFIRPCALAGLYCSSFEMVFVNQLSVTLPFQLLDFSYNEVLIFSILIALNVLKGHAGLHERDDIPKWIPQIMIQSIDHDTHHNDMISNFGILYLLDRIHGTYKPSSPL